MKYSYVIPFQNGKMVSPDSENHTSNFFKPIIQPKLTINQPNDIYEQEADAMETSIMRMPDQGNVQPFFHSVNSSNGIQKKCAHCEEEDKLQMKGESGAGGGMAAPAIVHNTINSGGKPLDANTKTFMESRFGYDFGNVQIHDDSSAHQSSAAINALAYTHGNHVVFGAGWYQPTTDPGKQLIAHELTHVLQQGGRSGHFNLPFIQRSITRPPVVQRGKNPGDCVTDLCKSISKSKPGSKKKAFALIKKWSDGMKACLDKDGPLSNASHQQDIVTAAKIDIYKEAKGLKGYFSQKTSQSVLNDFFDGIEKLCGDMKEEITLDFKYNIKIDDDGPPWANSAGEWQLLDDAFANLPQEATWTSPNLISFHREVDTEGNQGEGGLTNPNYKDITIYDRGLGKSPYGRSSATLIPTTVQTVEHEVGHVVMSQVSTADLAGFFNTIIHWEEYSWALVSSSYNLGVKQQTERTRLSADTGLIGKDLVKWLSTLNKGTIVTLKLRSYNLGDSYIEAYDTNQVSGDKALQYALTSKDEYLAELYALAVSAPDYLSSIISKDQADWLKDVVFKIPVDSKQLLTIFTVPKTKEQTFLNQAATKFTWEQIDKVFQGL